MSDASGSVPFTLDGIRRGFLRAQSFSIGIFVYGLAFGLMAAQAKLSALQAVMMSAVVYSGSAQLAAIGVLGSGAGSPGALLWALVATILVINARYILFSATLRPWLGGVSPLKAYSTLYFLGDGNWMMSMRAHEAGERDAGYVFGSGLGSFLSWIVGTYLGHIAVGFAPEPHRLGLDFFLAAFAAAMMAGMVRRRGDLAIVAVAALMAPLVAHVWGFGAAVVVSGLAGGLVAYLRHKPPEPAP